MSQQLQLNELYSVTVADIQRIFQETIEKFVQDHEHLPKIVYFDTSYLYSFSLDDYELIKKFTRMLNNAVYIDDEGVQHSPLAITWHRMLERWVGDQTVLLFGKVIKPEKISSTCDRVPNEGMINIANSFTGLDFNPMKWHAIGDGAFAGNNPNPSVTQLVLQQSRIDVTQSLDGGSLSTEGSTIFVVGNHPITAPSGNYTETGIFDHENTAFDRIGDYSIFPQEVRHDANANALASTTVIYQCST